MNIKLSDLIQTGLMPPADQGAWMDTALTFQPGLCYIRYQLSGQERLAYGRDGKYHCLRLYHLLPGTLGAEVYNDVHWQQPQLVQPVYSENMEVRNG